MKVLLLLGAVATVLVLLQVREHMATGVNNPQTWMSLTKDQQKAKFADTFDQLWAMMSPILHQAYSEGLEIAKNALSDAQEFARAANKPNDPLFKMVLGLTEADVTDYSKMVVAGPITVAFAKYGKTSSTPPADKPLTAPIITESQLRSEVEDLYSLLNKHINDQLPPQPPATDPVQAAMQVRGAQYAEKVRSFVKKYNTAEVKEAIIRLYKMYFIDQLQAGWSMPAQVPGATAAPAAPASAPAVVTTGTMADLEAQYAKAMAEYNGYVAVALTMRTKADIDVALAKVMDAKKKIMDILQKEMALITSDPKGLDAKRVEVMKRLDKVQDEYTGLAASNDKLETLRRIHNRESEKKDGAIIVHATIFGIACIMLVLILIFKGGS